LSVGVCCSEGEATAVVPDCVSSLPFFFLLVDCVCAFSWHGSISSLQLVPNPSIHPNGNNGVGSQTCTKRSLRTAACTRALSSGVLHICMLCLCSHQLSLLWFLKPCAQRGAGGSAPRFPSYLSTDFQCVSLGVTSRVRSCVQYLFTCSGFNKFI